MAADPGLPGPGGTVRVITTETTWERLVQRAFEKVRQAAAACPR